MPIVSCKIAQADDPIYSSGLTMTLINRSTPKEEKEFDLIDVYKRNRFLIKDNLEDIWFSIEEQIDKKYFEIPFAIITAWNPMNESFSKDVNIWLNNKLEEQLRALKDGNMLMKKVLVSVMGIVKRVLLFIEYQKKML